MKKYIVLISCCTLLLPFFKLDAQDIHFSQFYMAPLSVNPALAGAQHDINTSLNYKSQWNSVAEPFKTMAFSYDMRLMKNKASKGFLAAGINFDSDKAGDAKLSSTLGNLFVAYHVRLNPMSTLGAAVSAGMAQRSVDMGALKWGTQYDGTAYNSTYLTGEPTTGSSSISYMDFGGGICYNFDDHTGERNVTGNHDHRFNIGLGVYHINQPKYSFYGSNEKLYMKYVGHFTGTFSFVNTNVALVPGIMYSRQGKSQEIYAGSMLRFILGMDSKYTGFKQGAAISFGGYVRAQDAIVAAMLLEYANYSIGLSYDVNTSGLKAASNARGGFELALRFVTPNPFLTKGGSGIFN